MTLHLGLKAFRVETKHWRSIRLPKIRPIYFLRWGTLPGPPILARSLPLWRRTVDFTFLIFISSATAPSVVRFCVHVILSRAFSCSQGIIYHHHCVYLISYMKHPISMFSLMIPVAHFKWSWETEHNCLQHWGEEKLRRTFLAWNWKTIEIMTRFKVNFELLMHRLSCLHNTKNPQTNKTEQKWKRRIVVMCT